MKNSQSSIPQRFKLQDDFKLKFVDRFPGETSDAMQKGLEASLGCVQAKSFLYGPTFPRSFSGQTMEFNYTYGGKQANAVSDYGALSHNKLTVPSDRCGRPVRQEDHYVWPAMSPTILKDVHGQSHPFDGCFYPANYAHYFQAHWFPQIPFQMFPQSYSPDYMLQDFEYFVVIDFEATCDKERNPHPQEIIEFPSVLVNSRTGQLEDCFQIYVRPTHNQLLSNFCKDLTGIHQSQVDKGVTLSEALLMHDKWLEDKGIKNTNFAVVTWSSWDCRVMLESECRFKKIEKPLYFNRWINLKIPFNSMFGSAKRNLKEAVELAGLTWEGRAHCGLDDAKNTARLLAHLMHLGLKLSITNYIWWQVADESNAVPQYQQIPASESYLTYQAQMYNTSPWFTVFPFQPIQAGNPWKEPYVYCYCGATSMKRMNNNPGPNHGCFFFGCGNWTANKGPACQFFKWVSASDSAKPA
uniref:GRF-type domain-containing protein n=2 Tax=Chenopodium quinoa TaxID=63459 RepID=A0A803L3W5_CHEQI